MQKFYLLCYLLFSDDFSDDFIHHCVNFTKIRLHVIYCLVMISVMILFITGEILQNTISYVIYCLVMISVMTLSITG